MTICHVALRYALPLAGLLVLAPSASAASPQEQAGAHVLFNEGKKLATAGDFEHACPKFIESQRLDPTVGTLLNVGNCYEKLDKVASAYGAFREAEMTARDAGDADRQREAARRADALAPLLPKLAIAIAPAARVPGFEVRRDGAIVGEGQWGSSMPVDVGSHTIEATAPGYKPWSTEIRIDVNGAAASVRVQPLERLPVEPAPAGGGSTWSPQRTVGVALGGVGIVGVVVGSVFGAQTFSKNSASMLYCPKVPTMCYAQGVALRNNAYSAATISTVAFIVGGIGLASGAITFFTATKPAPKRVGLLATPRSLAVQGEW